MIRGAAVCAGRQFETLSRRRLAPRRPPPPYRAQRQDLPWSMTSRVRLSDLLGERRRDLAHRNDPGLQFGDFGIHAAVTGADKTDGACRLEVF
jgi:hypothetical protein